MTNLHALIGQARALAGDISADLCVAIGHDWQTDGGRSCPFYDTEKYCGGSQPVYKCARCGDYDYGDPSGPAFADCQRWAERDAQR